ncbi:MAG TPA: SMR family transporter [Pseudogracilibacillus sp.]|nr:SMR family transporter [Pseudogracilibacillus sp.]
MGWLFVILAAGFELAGVVGLTKYSRHKSLPNFLLYFGGFGLSFFFLYQGFNYLAVSTAYAVWIGIGTAGAVVMNMIFFGESKSAGKIVSVTLIVIGVVGLKYVS